MQQQHQFDQLPEDARQFWLEKQRQLNATIQRFSYAILVIPTRMPPVEKSGLLYVTAHNLWFEDFEKPPLFFLKTSSRYKKTLLQMPVSTLGTIETMLQSTLEEDILHPRKRAGFWAPLWRLLNADPVHLVITGTDSAGQEYRYAFRELDDPDAWMHSLSTLKDTPPEAEV